PQKHDFRPPEETRTHPGKQSIATAKPELQDSQLHPQQKQQSRVGNGNSSSQIYGDSYLPPGLGYTNRYIPYSVAENMSLQRMTIPGKGPVYTHPALLGNSSFYPQKHGLPYIGVHPNQGDFMTYQNSQGMASPSVSSHAGLERIETQDKTWNLEPYRNQERLDVDSSQNRDKEREKSTTKTIKASSKSLTCTREDVVCIDLVRDEPDEDPCISKHSATFRDSSRLGGNGCNQIQERDPPKPLPPNQAAEQRQDLKPNKNRNNWSSSNDNNKSNNSMVAKEFAKNSSFGDKCLSESPKSNPRVSVLNTRAPFCVNSNPRSPTYAQDNVDLLVDEEDEGSCCSKGRRSGLTKRIANSSGYVGDRFKCMTTELYADSSKLSREQKALQTAYRTSTPPPT
uniref:BCL6 corepressor n=1 Tax=Sander lucioperca TaxID=283035 RepID=A0A8C9Z783_SANLU